MLRNNIKLILLFGSQFFITNCEISRYFYYNIIEILFASVLCWAHRRISAPMLCESRPHCTQRWYRRQPHNVLAACLAHLNRNVHFINKILHCKTFQKFWAV